MDGILAYALGKKAIISSFVGIKNIYGDANGNKIMFQLSDGTEISMNLDTFLSHGNKNVLDSLQENNDGKLTYNGKVVNDLSDVVKSVELNGTSLVMTLGDGSQNTVDLIGLFSGYIKDIQLNQSKEIEITYGDNTVRKVSLESIGDEYVKGIVLNDANELVLTLGNGTTSKVDMSKFSSLTDREKQLLDSLEIDSNNVLKVNGEKIATIDDVKKSGVTSINGQKGDITIGKTEVGLGNVSNIEQASKVDFDNHRNDNTLHMTQSDKAKLDSLSNLEKATESDISNPINDDKYMTPELTKKMIDSLGSGSSMEWDNF